MNKVSQSTWRCGFGLTTKEVFAIGLTYEIQRLLALLTVSIGLNIRGKCPEYKNGIKLKRFLFHHMQ